MPSHPEWDMLLSSAQKNRPDEIGRLIEQDGVNPSHANAVGQSALHVAALWGHVEAVRRLLELGANVNAANSISQATPLHMVVQSHKPTIEQQLAVIDVLVAHGADVAQKDQFGCIPFDYTENKIQLQEKLQPTKAGVFVAIDTQNLEQLQLLVRDNTRSETFQGRNPVSYIVQNILHVKDGDDWSKLVAMLEICLRAGVDPDYSVQGEGSPLSLILKSLWDSYQKGQSSSLTELYEATAVALQKSGATFDEATIQFLHQAARRNQLTMAKFMVEQLQVDPNERNRQRMTPLHFAARSGQMEMLQYLVSLPNIDVSAKDDQGISALKAAQINEKTQAVQLLEQYI